MPGVRPWLCAEVASLSAFDCVVADSMMIVQPSPVQPGKLPDALVVGDGVAVVPGAGVVVAPGAGVAVVPGAVVAVGNGVAVGTAVGAGAAAEGVGVGVVEASSSGPLASATIRSTTPISASSPSPPERTIGT